jgi:hypothetical protein
MSKRLQKNLELLKILRKAKPSQRKAILESADNGLIYCLCECIVNILHGNVRITANRKRELAKHVKVLREIADRKTKVGRKRNLLIQKGGFLPALLAPVIGIASSLIGDLVSGLIKK